MTECFLAKLCFNLRMLELYWLFIVIINLYHIDINSAWMVIIQQYCMEIALEQNIKMKNMVTKHDIASSKQKFESDDSEGSDLSYESSLTDEDDNQVGRIQFFKQEMARFFINYPELINKNILQDEGERENGEEEERPDINNELNRNWESIADEIFSEAKESSTSLQSLAKRISLYRYKIDQCDIIDLLLQEKQVILKQIEAEIVQKKNQTNLLGQNQKQNYNIEQRCREDNSYLSWRKRKQFEFKINYNRNAIQRSQSVSNCKKSQIVGQKDKTKPVQKFHRSLHKAASQNQLNKKKKIEKMEQRQGINNDVTGVINSKKSQSHILVEKDEIKNMDESQVTPLYGSRLTSNWRHLVNFEPKTEIGRQLCEDIKKKNTPNDEPGIKKTIIQFLVNYKELINNQVINKVTLTQKIQKLYSQEAKELLMFYPSKINTYDNAPLNSTNNFKDGIAEDKFMQLLTKISDGPLIKYWRQLQQSKI